MALKDSPYLDKLQRDIIASERAKARLEAFEDAAKVVESLYQGGDYGGRFRVSPAEADYFTVRKRVLDIAAQAIRALATGEGR